MHASQEVSPIQEGTILLIFHFFLKFSQVASGMLTAGPMLEPPGLSGGSGDGDDPSKRGWQEGAPGRIQCSELRLQSSGLRTQNTELRSPNLSSESRTQNYECMLTCEHQAQISELRSEHLGLST